MQCTSSAVSPSCLPDDLGEAGGVSFVNPSTVPVMSSGPRSAHGLRQGRRNYDSARARVTFDCKPLPACDSSFVLRVVRELGRWQPPRCQGETCYTPEPGERSRQYIVLGDGNSALRFVDARSIPSLTIPGTAPQASAKMAPRTRTSWASASTCRRRRRLCRPALRGEWLLTIEMDDSNDDEGVTSQAINNPDWLVRAPVRGKLRGRVWVRQPALAPQRTSAAGSSQAPASGSLFHHLREPGFGVVT